MLTGEILTRSIIVLPATQVLHSYHSIKLHILALPRIKHQDVVVRRKKSLVMYQLV
jgi:DNA-directed RNA polymerase subunit H (RpoH/RPB5)